MPKTVELRQDPKHIFSNFDGYKLSLEPVPLLSQVLTAPVHKAEPSEEQYSFLHAELFTLQNLLQVDPWVRNTAYFVNTLGEMVRSAYDLNTGRPQPLVTVCRLPDPADGRKRKKGDYNYSFRFISEKYCVLCDGIKMLYLFDTGDRLKDAEWKHVAVSVINIANKDAENFIIFDCRLDTINNRKQISCALGRVQRTDSANNSSSLHMLELYLTRWLHDVEVGIWSLSIIDKLETKGPLYYCAYEPRGEAVVISFNQECKFFAEPVAGDKVVDVKPQLHGKSDEVPCFSWSQMNDDIIIKFDVREGKSKNNYMIQCTTKKLTVKCDEEVLFDSELFGLVDQDLTTWIIENNYLEVMLNKKKPFLHWPNLIAEGIAPKETTENNALNGMEQKPVANLEVPIEDCDLPFDDMDDIRIVRFDIATRKPTHSAFLGTSPPLFVTTIRPGFPAAFVTRQHVDACVWLQRYNPSNPDEWSLHHEGNLNAFAYVQASKQQKKFTDCSPDLSYAIICESHHHVFLYRAIYDSASGLRNRSGTQLTMGKQQLVTLDGFGEVLGIATAPSVVTLLTEKNVLYLQINY